MAEFNTGLFNAISGLADPIIQARNDAAADQALKSLPAGFGAQQPQNPFAFAVTPAGGAATGPSFPSTPAAPGAPTPQQSYAYQKFLEAGHTPQSASAMVANLSGESGRALRADAMNNSGTETPGAVNSRAPTASRSGTATGSSGCCNTPGRPAAIRAASTRRSASSTMS